MGDLIRTTATEGNGPGLTQTGPYRDAGYDGSGISIAVIDLLDAFAASGHTPAELRADLEHPNARGHAVAARAIERALAARGTPR